MPQTAFAVIVTAAIILLHSYAIFCDVNFWPFTSYPMYSHDWSADNIISYRARLAYGDGSSAWWEPLHYKDKQELSIRFGILVRTCQSSEEFGERARSVIRSYIMPDLLARDLGARLPLHIWILQRKARIDGDELVIGDSVLYRVDMITPGQAV
jgi:hypothetical protein